MPPHGEILSPDHASFEVVTRSLGRDEVMALVEPVAELCRALGAERVETFLGAACCGDRVWQSSVIGVEELVGFVRAHVGRGHYRPGASDLHVGDREGRFEFRFCEGADLHFVTTEAQSFDLVHAAWSEAALDPQVVREG